VEEDEVTVRHQNLHGQELSALVSKPQLGDIQHPDSHGTRVLEQVGGRKVQQELGLDRQVDIGVLMTQPQVGDIAALVLRQQVDDIGALVKDDDIEALVKDDNIEALVLLQLDSGPQACILEPDRLVGDGDGRYIQGSIEEHVLSGISSLAYFSQ